MKATGTIVAIAILSVVCAWLLTGTRPDTHVPQPILARVVVVEIGKDLHFGSPVAEMVDSLGFHRVMFMSELPSGTAIGDTLVLTVGWK